MLDMGFEPQVRQIVESTGLGRNSAHGRQSMMFSATFPREVLRVAYLGEGGGGPRTSGFDLGRGDPSVGHFILKFMRAAARCSTWPGTS